MAEKSTVSIIITAGYHTNRSYLARSFAKMLTELGFEVDLSHVGVIDIEPPCDVEKGPVIDPNSNAKFSLSEHYLGTPIQLEPLPYGKAQPLVRPAVPQLMGRDEVGIAAIGGPNTGKSTLLHMFGDLLESEEVESEQIKYDMISEDYFAEWSTEELLHNMQKIKSSTKVVLYTRKSYASEPLALVLASTDNYVQTET